MDPVCDSLKRFVLPQQERTVINHGWLHHLVTGEDSPRDSVYVIALNVAVLFTLLVGSLEAKSRVQGEVCHKRTNQLGRNEYLDVLLLEDVSVLGSPSDIWVIAGHCVYAWL